MLLVHKVRNGHESKEYDVRTKKQDQPNEELSEVKFANETTLDYRVGHVTSKTDLEKFTVVG